jgi:hypothetical protein
VFFVFAAVLAEYKVVLVECVDTFGLVDLRYGFWGRRTRARGIECAVLLYRWTLWRAWHVLLLK